MGILFFRRPSIPDALTRCTGHRYVRATGDSLASPLSEGMEPIIDMLRQMTAHEFALYNEGTIGSRIAPDGLARAIARAAGLVRSGILHPRSALLIWVERPRAIALTPQPANESAIAAEFAASFADRRAEVVMWERLRRALEDVLLGGHRLPVVRRTASADAKAITFDDAPSPATLPKIFELLDRFEAKVTFFLSGTRVVRHPDLADAILAKGHPIYTHGFYHVRMDALPSERFYTSLGATEAMLLPVSTEPQTIRSS